MILESSNVYGNYPSLSLVTFNARRLTIDYSGNVGINTTTPVSLFQLNSGFSKSSAGRASGANLAYGTSYLGFNAARGTDLNWLVDGDSAHNGGGVIYGDVFGNIYMAPIPSTGTDARTLADVDVKNSIRFKVGADALTNI